MANKDINLLFGFYADGYYDRRPMKVQIATTSRLTSRLGVGVSINSPSVAYRGTLVYNPENNASTFSPAAGRRLDRVEIWNMLVKPDIIGVHLRTEYSNGTRKYREISLVSGDCRLESRHLHILPTFGYSIRCVKDEMSSN